MHKSDLAALKRLRKALSKKQQTPSNLKNDERIDDIRDFSSWMQDVKPLKNDTVYFAPPRAPIKIRPPLVETAEIPNYFYISEPYEEAPKTFSKKGRGYKDIKKLQQYAYPIISNLDLHGEKLEGLDELLTEFCHYVQSKGVCGRIIHGSGLGSKNAMPVLKNRVRTWLCEYPDVLAYAEEKNNDGSVLILLTKIKSFYRK